MLDNGVEAILIKLTGTSDADSDSAISSSDISPGEVGLRKKQFAVGSGMKLEKCCPEHSIFLLRFLPMFVKKLLNFSATSC